MRPTPPSLSRWTDELRASELIGAATLMELPSLTPFFAPSPAPKDTLLYTAVGLGGAGLIYYYFSATQDAQKAGKSGGGAGVAGLGHHPAVTDVKQDVRPWASLGLRPSLALLWLSS